MCRSLIGREEAVLAIHGGIRREERRKTQELFTQDKDVQISTKVYMLTGNTYTVVWKLAWRGGRYKVTDVKVLGFSLVYLQRGLFTSYVSKRKGDVGQLVAALNR